MYRVLALVFLITALLHPSDTDGATITYNFKSIVTNAEWESYRVNCSDSFYLSDPKCMNQNFTDDFSGMIGIGQLKFDHDLMTITECTTGFSQYFNSCSSWSSYVYSFDPVTGELGFQITDFAAYVKDIRISPLGGTFSYMDDDEPFSLRASLSFFDVSADLPPPPAVPVPASGALLLSILPLAGLWRSRRRHLRQPQCPPGA